VKNFVYHNPTKILFGRDTISRIGPETATYGANVLLVYGQGSILRNGVHHQVIESLNKAGCTVVEFGGVQPNPTLRQVKEGVDILRRKNCGVICAVGGGSVIDTAKAISCAHPAPHDVWRFFTAKKSIKSAVPLTCIATVAGSGSENNSGMVITNEERQHKFGYGSRLLHPKVSILDPRTTYTVPEKQTAYGAVDIISHLVEFYCTNSVEFFPLQKRIMEGIIESVMQNTEIALRNPTDYDSRAQLLWSASLALSGLPSAGLGRVGMPMHLIEHSISALHDTIHGAGLAVILPAWLEFEGRSRPRKIAGLGRRLFGLAGADDEDIAAATAQQFKQWFEQINCPVSLTSLIGECNLLPIGENTRFLAKIWRLQEYDREKVLSILDLCR